MNQEHEMFIPINMNYDKTLLYRFIKESFNETNLWKKLLNRQKPKNYWLEIRGHQVGRSLIIKKTLRTIQNCVDSNLIALHQLPPRMSMPKHRDISTSGRKNLRKSILILPITMPCPGTRFYLKNGDILTKPFEGPTLIKVTGYHDVYNYLNEPRITLQISFKKSYEEMKSYFQSQYQLC